MWLSCIFGLFCFSENCVTYCNYVAVFKIRKFDQYGNYNTTNYFINPIN